MRSPADRREDAGDGWHRARTRGRPRSSRDSDHANDRLRRSARARARAGRAGARRHRKTDFGRADQGRGARSAGAPTLAGSAALAAISEILQQPLDVIQLDLWPRAFAKALAQFLQNAPRALGIDLTRQLYAVIVSAAPL